jgi:hypothetical protein
MDDEINTGIYWSLYPNKQIDPHTSHLINNLFNIKSGKYKVEYEIYDGSILIDTIMQQNNIPKDISQLVNDYIGKCFKCCECGQYVAKQDDLYNNGENYVFYRNFCNWVHHKKTNQIRCYISFNNVRNEDWLQIIIDEILKPNGYILNGIYEVRHADCEYIDYGQHAIRWVVDRHNPLVVKVKNNSITSTSYTWWTYSDKRYRCFLKPQSNYQETYKTFRKDKRGRRKK